MTLKKHLAMAALRILLPAAAMFAGPGCDPTPTDPTPPEDFVDPLNPDIRLAYCRESNIDPCTYSAEEVQSLLASPNGLATKTASSSTSAQKTKLAVSYDTQTTSAAPWSIAESADGKTITLTFHAKDKAGYTIEVREFWYLMAQALTASARTDITACPTLGGDKPLFSLDDALSPDASEDCIYNLSAAHALLVPLLDGSAPRDRTGDELAADIDGLISYAGVTSNTRLGPALTDSGTRRRLFVVTLTVAVGVLVVALVVEQVAANSYLHSQLPAPDHQDLHIKTVQSSIAYHQDTCSGVSVYRVEGCQAPLSEGCVVGDVATGNLSEQLVPCSDAYPVICTDGSGEYKNTTEVHASEADAACLLTFGAGFSPVAAPVPPDSIPTDLKLNHTRFATGLVSCTDTTGRTTQCPGGRSSPQPSPGAFSSPSGSTVPVGEPRTKKQKQDDDEDSQQPPDDSQDLQDDLSNCGGAGAGKPCRIETVRIHTLNIGQGSCHVVQCKALDTSTKRVTVENAVIDCGSSQKTIKGIPVGLTEGGAAFYMATHGVTTSFHPNVDVMPPSVYVTHAHADHVNYLAALFAPAMSLVQPSDVITAGAWSAYARQPRFMDFYNSLPASTNKRQLPDPSASFADYTKSFSTCAGATLEVLTANNPVSDGGSAENSNSAILLFHWPAGKVAAVFPGDAYGATEAAAVAKQFGATIAGADVRVLAASHHGSDRHNSNSDALLQAVSPTHEVYSAARKFGHPKEAIVTKVENLPSLAADQGHGLFYSTDGALNGDVVGGGVTYIYGGTTKSHHATMSSGNIVISRRLYIFDGTSDLDPAEVQTGKPSRFAESLSLPPWSSESGLAPICYLPKGSLTCSAGRRRLSENVEPDFLVPGAYYSIQSVSSERFVETPGTSECATGPVVQHHHVFPPIAREYWQFKRSPSSRGATYSVVSFETGKCLIPDPGSSDVRQAPCSGAQDQLWVFHHPGVQWQLEHLASGLCLSTGGKTQDGDELEMAACASSDDPDLPDQLFDVQTGLHTVLHQEGYTLDHLLKNNPGNSNMTILSHQGPSPWGLNFVMLRADTMSPWFMMTGYYHGGAGTPPPHYEADTVQKQSAGLVHDFIEQIWAPTLPLEASFALSPVRQDGSYNILSAYADDSGTQYCLEGPTAVVPCDATHLDQRVVMDLPGSTTIEVDCNVVGYAPPLSELEQYTPDQANWDTFAAKPLAGGNTSHDPDGVAWISPEDWAAAKWDGTIYNPSKMTKAEFSSAICPSVDRVRGLREVFYEHHPFADEANPTKAEVDEWHRIAINHVRALVGYTSADRQVKKDHCMFARALWADERKFTTKWDDEYPGVVGSAAGPCQGSSNSHCGASFLPSLEDQAPYLPDGHPGCGLQQGAEGIFSGPKSNIPWSIKWSRAFCNTLMAEGFWGGHVGPWFHREKFGFSFWDNDPDNNNNNAILRAKWTGALMPNLYCNPADPTCDPDNTGP